MEAVAIEVREKDSNELEFRKQLDPYDRQPDRLQEIATVLIETYGEQDYTFDLIYRI